MSSSKRLTGGASRWPPGGTNTRCEDLPLDDIVFQTNRPEVTFALARALSPHCEAGDVIALVGGLGAGKTVFVKGLARGLGVPSAQEVTSPTFVLITEYSGRLTLYHVDAYRLEGAADFEALGADEILFGDGVCVIEWADRVAGCLPADRLDVALAVEGPLSRRVALSTRSPAWGGRWRAIAAALDAGARRG